MRQVVLYIATESSFLSTATNIDSENISYLQQTQGFQMTFLEAINCETGGEEKTHSKVAAFI